jgi:DNA-binding MarR family transcriptional regulator
MTSAAQKTKDPRSDTEARERERFPRQPVPGPVEDRVGYLLARNQLAIREEAERALAPLGLGGGAVDCSPKHVVCLSLIASEGPMSQQALGELISMDRTTVVAVVDWLELNGLVERRRNPTDRRAYALEITAEGRRWLREAEAALRGVERRFLAPLSGEERRQLVGLLRRLLTG